MAVGTALKVKGHKVTIYDGDLDKVPLNFPYYGFGPTTPEYPYALTTRDRIKKVNSEARIIIGGPHAVLNTQECLKDDWDCVVCGDGELVVETAFLTDVFLINEKENPLDWYPIIDRTIIDLSKYKYYLNGRLATTLMTSQGCPFKCGFCAKNYRTVRFRSVESVFKEIEILHSKFGYTALAFPEDLFILDKQRTERICGSLKSLGIIWRCLIRADIAVKHGKDFIKTLAKSGCVSVGMGVESGSDKILSIIHKGETVATIKEAIKMLKDEGIKVKGFFILGLPGETKETLEATNRFLDEVQLDDVDIKIYHPFPGTPIWNNKDSYDIQWHEIEREKSFYKGRLGEYYGNVSTSSLTNNQIKEEWVKMERSYKPCAI
jgi:radical SAM superfamily enzyme YgiQ (UPF0313 family)